MKLKKTLPKSKVKVNVLFSFFTCFYSLIDFAFNRILKFQFLTYICFCFEKHASIRLNKKKQKQKKEVKIMLISNCSIVTHLDEMRVFFLISKQYYLL